jgi:hypothetical protein
LSNEKEGELLYCAAMIGAGIAAMNLPPMEVIDDDG